MDHTLKRRGRTAYLVVAIGAVIAPMRFAAGQVVVYEATMFPEEAEWTRDDYCGARRELADGWLVQEVDACPGQDPPGGQQELYSRGLAQFVGAPTFFIEWRMVTSGPSTEIIGVAPAVIFASGNFATKYHFAIATDQVRMIRDNLLPIEYFDIDPTIPHTYRLELDGDRNYTVYIDGLAVDSGVPEGPYPANDSAFIGFRAKSWYEPSVTEWDYIRFGVIPKDGSGDYDSDGAVSAFDYYFAAECMDVGGPGHDAGPGCRFADFDGDSDTDLADFAAFQLLFSE